MPAYGCPIMMLDRLDLFPRYLPLHPGFETAFHYLFDRKWVGLPSGRHPLPDGRIYASIERRDGRGLQGAKMEFHRLYIDIQYTIAGNEVIGWRNLEHCHKVLQPYDANHDCGLFADEPDSWCMVQPGCFAIFFPEDVHAPLAGEGPLHKIVMKVPTQW